MRSVRLVDDTVLYLHPEGEALSDAIARDSDYFEREILDYMADKHVQHEIILDIGANIGNHTAYFAQYLEYKSIVAFEPVPENYALLRYNARYPNVYLRQEAIGHEISGVYIMPNRSNMGASEINPYGIPVKQIPIDTLRLSAPVTLMKIDVEWYEPQVLEGAKKTIERDKPLILIEDSNMQYIELLVKMGYHLEKAWSEHKTYLYVSEDA